MPLAFERERMTYCSALVHLKNFATGHELVFGSEMPNTCYILGRDDVLDIAIIVRI
jgi:hypothetical protein